MLCSSSSSDGKASVCNAGDPGSVPGLGRSPGKGNGNPLQYSCLEYSADRGVWRATVYGVTKNMDMWHPTPVFLPGKSHGRKSLVGCSPWGLCRTRLSDFTFTFHFYALEKEMATHSSVLAWRILGTGEPGVLPSMGLHRVGHD